MSIPKLEGARFLVTGGCGFVGSNIVNRLVASPIERCVVLDNLFTGFADFLPKSDKLEFIEGSITDQAILDDVLPRVDYIISCAAVNIMAAQENPGLDLKVNAGGILKTLNTAERLDNIKRIVYTSTASVYGNPEYLPVSEMARTSPMSNYAVSKLAGENYMKVSYLLADLPTVVMRYSNVFGPNQTPANPYCGVVGKFIRSVLEKGVVCIHGSGQQTRDLTYVDDVVEATILAAISPKGEGEVFNVANGNEVSVLAVAEKIFHLLGKEPKLRFVEGRDIDNIYRRCLNIERIRTRLKWNPRHSIDQGLEKTVAWYLETMS